MVSAVSDVLLNIEESLQGFLELIEGRYSDPDVRRTLLVDFGKQIDLTAGDLLEKIQGLLDFEDDFLTFEDKAERSRMIMEVAFEMDFNPAKILAKIESDHTSYREIDAQFLGKTKGFRVMSLMDFEKLADSLKQDREECKEDSEARSFYHKCAKEGCKRKSLIDCRCGAYYCGRHRLAKNHDCTYDYKKAHRERLGRENSALVNPKLEKI